MSCTFSKYFLMCIQHFLYILCTINKQTTFGLALILASFWLGVGQSVCHFSCRYMMLLYFCVMYKFRLVFSCPSSFNLISCCRRAFRNALLREQMICVFCHRSTFPLCGFCVWYRLSSDYTYMLPVALNDLSTQSSLENFDKFLFAIIWLLAESYINLI